MVTKLLAFRFKNINKCTNVESHSFDVLPRMTKCWALNDPSLLKQRQDCAISKYDEEKHTGYQQSCLNNLGNNTTDYPSYIDC